MTARLYCNCWNCERQIKQQKKKYSLQTSAYKIIYTNIHKNWMDCNLYIKCNNFQLDCKVVLSLKCGLFELLFMHFSNYRNNGLHRKWNCFRKKNSATAGSIRSKQLSKWSLLAGMFVRTVRILWTRIGEETIKQMIMHM